MNKVVELEGPAKKLALSSMKSDAEDVSSSTRIILQVDRVGGRRRPIPSSRFRHVNRQHHNLGQHEHSPASSVDRRNARERRRVRLVNLGFTALRQHVPPRGGGKNKKMSKVETLRAAIAYIKQLQDAVSEDQEENQEHPDDEDDARSAGACPSPSTMEELSSVAASSSPSSSSLCSSLPSFLDNDSYSSASPMFLDDEDEDFLELVDLVL